MKLEDIEKIYNAVDCIFIDAVDNGFKVDRTLARLRDVDLHDCSGYPTWVEVMIDKSNKDFRMMEMRDYSLTLNDYLDPTGLFKIKFITLDRASKKETFTKFPIFNFKDIRKFKIIIERIKKSN